MDFISMKDPVRSSAQDAASLSLTILGEPHRLRVLWRSNCNMTSYIEKMVIKGGDVHYQTYSKPGEICNMGGLGATLSATEFYAPSYLNSTTLSYSEPQFLTTLGGIVIKTENPYTHFMVAQHFTKKIYFIASDSLTTGGSLYAADIGKEATEIVAEKIDYNITNKRLTAVAVDQINGDIILAGYNIIHQYFIESLQKTCYLSEILKFAGVSSS